MKLWPGNPYPLGENYDGSGTNFSLFSSNAERVELSLFDDEGKETCYELKEVTGFCRHGYLPQVKPGQRYGYRVYRPWDLNSWVKEMDTTTGWIEEGSSYKAEEKIKVDSRSVVVLRHEP